MDDHDAAARVSNTDLFHQLFPTLHETRLLLGVIAPQLPTPDAQTCISYLGDKVNQALQALEHWQVHQTIQVWVWGLTLGWHIVERWFPGYA